MICHTPNTHIHNLNVALNGSNASLTSPTNTDRPQPPTNRTIWSLTLWFQEAIQEVFLENDVFELSAAINQYTWAMNCDSDFGLYNCFNLRAVRKIALQTFNSATGPAAPPAALLPPQPTGNFSGIKMYTLESEIDHEKIDTDQLIVKEA